MMDFYLSQIVDKNMNDEPRFLYGQKHVQSMKDTRVKDMSNQALKITKAELPRGFRPLDRYQGLKLLPPPPRKPAPLKMPLDPVLESNEFFLGFIKTQKSPPFPTAQSDIVLKFKISFAFSCLGPQND